MNSQTTLTYSLTTSTINIPADTNLTYVAFLKKGWRETQKLQFNFTGENSTLNFIALILGLGEETFPFETISNHEIPHTNAYYNIRGVMFDKSQVYYRGSLNIKKSAQLTDCYLAHHTLMLSKNAKTHTIPSLEIEADDVKAGHAATIGKVDEDILFYLASRGINKKQGQSMLIKGFLETDLKKISDPNIQLILAKNIEEALQC
ncbi:SufD family Fe-S cluster assembly protein [Candidatus Peregrinibacteria bacterium]|nr:SufD family Fe-S cluster assembly protein [Candidatus Peregrinibacteria bacterium]